MLISEVISHLEHIKFLKGNIEVCFIDFDGTIEDVLTVSYGLLADVGEDNDRWVVMIE